MVATSTSSPAVDTLGDEAWDATEKEVQQSRGMWGTGRLNEMDVRGGYDKIASHYDKSVMTDGWGTTFDLMLPEIGYFLRYASHPAQKVKLLDAGCGTGLLIPFLEKYLRAELPRLELHGVDLSENQLVQARALYPGRYASLQWADIQEGLPFPPDSFDLVISNGVLTYCDSRPIKHLVRAVKPGGALLVAFREETWKERKWEEGLESLGAAVRYTKLFDPFPRNDDYTHNYIIAAITKGAGKPVIIEE